LGLEIEKDPLGEKIVLVEELTTPDLIPPHLW